MGRPTRYSKKLAEEICDRLGEGMTLFEIADDEAMPSKRTIIRWSRERDDFGPIYRQAIKDKAEICVHKADHILSNINGDRDAAYCAKIEFDGNMKLAARLDAPRFNDQVLLRHGGEVPGDPIKVEVDDSDYPDPRAEMIRRLEQIHTRAEEMSLMSAEHGDQEPLYNPQVAAHREIRARFNPVSALEAEAKEEAARAAFFESNPNLRPPITPAESVRTGSPADVAIIKSQTAA